MGTEDPGGDGLLARVAGTSLSRTNIAFFTVLAGIWAVVLAARDHYIFSTRVVEQGDQAANSILIEKALHFRLLVGSYSREGFNHPGPALLYIESFGQSLFYSVFHLVASAYGGQVLGIYVLNAVLLAAVSAVFYRYARSYAVAVGATALVLWLTNGHTMWASSWMPYVYIAPFLLAVVSGASLASGTLSDLPLYVLATGLLVHGHVGFIPIMGLYSLVILFIWVLRNRRHPQATLVAVADHRSTFAASGVLVTLFLIPIILELMLHWPGEWGKYIEYIRNDQGQHSHSVAQGITYVTQYWPGGTAVDVGLLVCGAVVATVAYRRRALRNRAFILCLVGAVTWMTAEVTWYGMRGVDFLNPVNAYTGYFYYVVPPLLASATLLLVGEIARAPSFRARIIGRAKGQSLTWIGVHGSTATGTSVALCCVLLIALFQVNFVDVYRGEPDLVQMTAALKSYPARHNRIVVIDLQEPYNLHDEWPIVAGLVVQASKTRLPLCVNDPNMAFLFSSSEICTSAQLAAGYQFAVTSDNRVAPSGWRIVWHDRTATVLYRAQPS